MGAWERYARQGPAGKGCVQAMGESPAFGTERQGALGVFGAPYRLCTPVSLCRLSDAARDEPFRAMAARICHRRSSRPSCVDANPSRARLFCVPGTDPQRVPTQIARVTVTNGLARDPGPAQGAGRALRPFAHHGPAARHCPGRRLATAAQGEHCERDGICHRRSLYEAVR